LKSKYFAIFIDHHYHHPIPSNSILSNLIDQTTMLNDPNATNANGNPAINANANANANVNPDINDNAQLSTMAKIAMLIIFASVVICIVSFITLFTFGLIVDIQTGLPEKPHMIVTINETGTYVAYDVCGGDILDCQTEKYLVIDKDTLIVEKFGVYCLDPMDQPIAYKVKDIIQVAYDSNILAHKAVLYGCDGPFVSYGIYIMEKLLFVSVAVCIGSFIMGIIGVIIVELNRPR